MKQPRRKRIPAAARPSVTTAGPESRGRVRKPPTHVPPGRRGMSHTGAGFPFELMGSIFTWDEGRLDEGKARPPPKKRS